MYTASLIGRVEIHNIIFRSIVIKTPLQIWFPRYGVPVILHTDHCAAKLLPWLDGMLDASEAYFKAHGEPLFSSHMLDLSEEPMVRAHTSRGGGVGEVCTCD